MHLVDKVVRAIYSEYNFIDQIHISNPYFPLVQHTTRLLHAS